MINIAVDAMGGDNAPRELVKGAVEAAAEKDLGVSLVGDSRAINRELKRYKRMPNISIVHASEVIAMDETPAIAVKQKKDSSINVAVNLVKEGKADAVISAGNTGAFMTAALFGLGRIKGIERPAIATIFPTVNGGEVILLDMGANVDCKPKHMVQFAQMGSLYAEEVMEKKAPKVGLLNIGEEAGKGNQQTDEAYPLIEQAGLNFIGNIESKDILHDKADVIVCDGFVGNIVLKFAESLSQDIVNLLKKELSYNLLSMFGALLLKPAFSNLKKRIDYDEHGGALLLGVNGICIKAHGRANSKAIKSAIRVASEAAKKKIVEKISQVSQ